MVRRLLRSKWPSSKLLSRLILHKLHKLKKKLNKKKPKLLSLRHQFRTISPQHRLVKDLLKKQ